jgi:hypothetical protein
MDPFSGFKGQIRSDTDINFAIPLVGGLVDYQRKPSQSFSYLC